MQGRDIDERHSGLRLVRIISAASDPRVRISLCCARLGDAGHLSPLLGAPVRCEHCVDDAIEIAVSDALGFSQDPLLVEPEPGRDGSAALVADSRTILNPVQPPGGEVWSVRARTAWVTMPRP